MKTRIPWIVKHPIQAKYLLIVVLAMLAPTLLLGFCLYNVVFYLLANQLAFPEAIMANVEPVVRQVNSLLIVLLPIMALLFFLLAIMISHRFGGPIERLESELDRILSGEFRHRIKMRNDDDLKGVASRINALVDRLNGK